MCIRSSEAPDLILQLFGGPLLKAKEASAPCLSPMSLLFLSVLALEGDDGISREGVKNRLWSSGTDSELSQRLSQLLYMTRLRLGHYSPAIKGGDPLRLDRQVIGSDLEVIRGFLQNQRADLAWASVRKGLLSAAPLKHERLRAIYAESLESRLLSAIRDCCSSVLKGEKSQQDWSGQQRAAETLIAVDGPSLHAIRHIMIAMAMQDRYTEAEAIYERYSSYVNDTGNVDDTKALLSIKDLVARRIPPVSLGGPAPSGMKRCAPPFVGRRTELGWLREALLNPVDPGPSLVILSGPMGIGKTRLCHEFARHLPKDGARVLMGLCHEAQRHIPLSPLLDAFDDQWVDVHIGKMPEPWQSEMRRIKDPFSDGGCGAPVPGRPGNPRVLLECLRKLLASLCRSGRILVWLDGAQFADTTTIQAIASLLRFRYESPLSFLLAVRTPIQGLRQLDPNRPVSWLSRLEKSEELLLKGLGDAAAVDTVKWVLRGKDLYSEHPEVAAVAGSNPLHLVETASHWRKIRRPPVDATSPLPPVFHKIFSERLSKLKPHERHLLETVCSAGEPVALQVLQRVGVVLNGDFRSAVEELFKNGLIRISKNAASPQSELVRRTVIAGLSQAGRIHVQTGLARALEAHGSTPAATLARHFARSGLNAKASAYGLKAARVAQQNGAFDDAITSLELALPLAIDSETRTSITKELGVLLHRCRRMEPAIPLLRSAERRHRDTGDLARALDCKLRRTEAEIVLDQLPPTEAHERLLTVFREATANSWFNIAAKALYYDIRYQRAWGNIRWAHDILTRAHLLLASPLPTAAKVRVASLLSLSAYFGDVDDGLRYAEMSVDLARKTQRPDIHIDALSRKVAVLIARGELNTLVGAQALQECEALARTSPDPLRRLHPLLNRCAWLSDIGEADAALTGFASIEDVVIQLDTPDTLPIYWCNRGMAAVRAGSFKAAEAYFDHAETALGNQVHSEIRTQITAGRGICAVESGDLRSASNYSDLLEIPNEWYFDPTMVFGLRMLLATRRGSFREALQYSAQALTAFRPRFPVYWIDILIRHSDIAIRKAPGCLLQAELAKALDIADTLNLPHYKTRIERILQEA
ncbi:MAG: ATP-binding protein [Gemmatimonadales bacterium]|nr:MAG: ATP-binding protein [Gemmatimonadales bacterium]